jgi:hypothetical protein
MRQVPELICPTTTAEYFSREDWTGEIIMKSLKKSV